MAMRPLLRLVALIGGVTLLPPAYAADDIGINAEQIRRLGIATAPVQTTNTVVSERFLARVVIPPGQERVISAPQSGLITELRLATGDSVTQGQALALIESPGLVGLQREFLQASTQVRLARADLRRDEQLFKEGIIAERRYLATRSQYEEASAALDERRQTLALAGMNEAAIERLQKTRKLASVLEVVSPIDGEVLEQQAVVGQRVEVADPLFRVARLEPLWLAIRVPLDKLQSVQPGSMVELPCEGASAQVTVIGRDVDPENQTVLARAEAKEVTGCLRPGQFVQVRVATQAEQGLFLVPSGSLVRSGEQTAVFLRTASGFRVVPVEIVSEQEAKAAVRAQLSVGDEVAVSGVASLKAHWLGHGGGE